MALEWVACHIGELQSLDNAIAGGWDGDGSIIYVARSTFSGVKLPAKAIPAKRACYVSSEGLEISVKWFEVLTGDSSAVSWEPSSHGQFVANALSIDRIGGEDIFLGRTPFSTSQAFGRVQQSHRCLLISLNGREHRIEHYEVLVHRKKPQTADRIEFHHDTPQTPLLHYQRCDKLTASFGLSCQSLIPVSYSQYHWAHTTSRSSIPRTAVLGGRDSNLSLIYVGRCMHKGNLLPCRVVRSELVALVTFNGLEIEKQSFEILLGSCSKWKACCDGNIPSNAFRGGYTEKGETLYIGRVELKGALIVGKVHEALKRLYIGCKGREYSFHEYEVLVED